MSKTTKITKTERLETRLPKEHKEQLLLAATLEGLSISDFVLQALQEACQVTLKKHQHLQLDRQDSLRLIEALQQTPEPNTRLKSAWQFYQQLEVQEH